MRSKWKRLFIDWKTLNFEWDPKKNESNYNKHGIYFEDAIYIFLNMTFEQQDERHDYGEVRVIALGKVDGRVLDVVYTDRGTRRRMISARMADRNERRDYEQALASRTAPDS